jgi:hypothetical protein
MHDDDDPQEICWGVAAVAGKAEQVLAVRNKITECEAGDYWKGVGCEQSI